MFNQKNALISLAVTVFLAGCGGGGGSGTPSTASTTATTTTSSTGTTPATTTPTPTPTPAIVVDESLMAGFMVLVGNQMVINGMNDRAFNLDQFNDTTRSPAGAYSFAPSTNAPISSFALRLHPEGMDIPAGQTKLARLAFEIKDRAIGGVQALQVLIDQVEVSVSADNQFTVSVPATAKLYIYVNNRDGQSATLSVGSLAVDMVKIVAFAGDASSHVFTLNLEAAVSAALAGAQGDTAKLAVINSLKDFLGEFDASFTLANVTMHKDDGSPLVGPAITVIGSGHPPVVGGGVKGILNVEAH